MLKGEGEKARYVSPRKGVIADCGTRLFHTYGVGKSQSMKGRFRNLVWLIMKGAFLRFEIPAGC